MKPKKNALLLAGSLTALLASHSAHAAIQTWDDGAANATWDDTSLNWAGAAWTDGNDAVFGATGAGAITVSDTRSVGNLDITSAGYSFSGGILSVANLSAANTWTIGNDAALSSDITADFSGGSTDGRLVKMGEGTLTLSGAVNATGFGTSGSGNYAINVSAGNLVLSGTSTFSNAGLFATGSGDATISGGTHDFTGTVNRRGIAMNGGRTVTVSGGTVNTVRILVGNGSSGSFTQSGGTVIMPVTGVVELGVAGTSQDASVFNLDGGTLVALRIAPTGTWAGTSTINLNGGTFTAVGMLNTNLFSATDIFVKEGGVVINPNGRDVTISSSMQAHPTSTGGGLTKGTARMLTLSGANTYTGTTNITAGGLTIGKVSTASGSTILSGATGVGDVVLGNGVTLGQSSSLWYAPTVTLKGDVTLAGNNRQNVGFKVLDLDGGTRTISINPTGGNVKQTIPGDTALEGTGRSRWEMLDISDTHPYDGTAVAWTLQNGNLVLDSNLTGDDYAGFMFQFPTSFADNAGLTVGPNVYLQTWITGALGSTTADSAKLTVNGIWNLLATVNPVGFAGGDQTIHSLSGSGRVYASMLVTNNKARTITLNGTSGSTDFSGTLNNGPGTGKLSLVKTGASTQILSGANTYTGDTTVTGGILGVTGASIADTNKLVIDGGKVDVTGTEVVEVLVLGEETQIDGTYGSTDSPATFKDNTYFSGTGVINVGPLVVSGYSTWASANAGSQTADLDFDNDGVSNGVEYFMGETGSTFTANPSVVTVGAVSTVTWPRDLEAVATFKVQISDTLAAGGWTDIVPPAASIDESNPNQVTYTLPSGAPKKFCRLSVTP